MASKELRGASRREFLRGAVALGAAMGWGPSRLLDFIQRGGGNAAADCSTKGIQNLVVLVGATGAHGYPHMMFPHPDSFGANGRFLMTSPPAGDSGCKLAFAFMQNTSAGGTPHSSFGIAGATDFNNMPMSQRFSRLYGVDNMSYGGFRSNDATSRSLDTSFWGQDSTPSNTAMGPDRKFIVTSKHTPWVAKYGLKKAITAMDGAGINPFHISGAHNPYVNVDKKWTMMGAAATIQLTRPSIVPVIIVGALEAESGGGDSSAFYGSLPGAPAPAIVNSAAGMVDLFNSNLLSDTQIKNNLIQL